jgi:hypothetical protein
MANILEVIINGDAKGLNQSLSSASSKLKAFGRQTTDIGTRLSTRLTLPIGLAGAAMIKLASDTDESLNKVDVAFKGSSQQVRDFAKTTLQSFGIARGQALDMAALFGDMSTSMGLSTAEAAKMSISLTGLAGDLASFKNINIEEVTTALAGVFTGETESLKRLGIVMTEVNLQQFALDKGMTKSIKKMNQAEKVALRYEYIIAKTANSQGDFSRTSGGAANQMRMFSQGLKELGSQFGELILPFFTKLVVKANDLIRSLKNLSPQIVKMGLIVAGLAAALPPLLIVIGSFTTAIAAIVSPVGLAVAALGLLFLKFNEISNAINDFTLILKMVFQLAISKSIEQIKLLMNNLSRFGAIMKELITKRFESDLDSVNKKYDEQADKIRENAKEQQDLIKKFAELRKETNDLPPTIDVLLGKLEQLAKGFFKTQGAAEEAKKSFEGFGNGLNFSFDVGADSLAKTTTWGLLNKGIDSSIKKFEEIDKKRKEFIDGINQAANDIINAGFVNAFVSMGEAIGQTMSGISGAGQNFTKSLLSTIGTMATQLGKLAISVGIGIEGIKAALKSLNPAVAIAAGVALVALGSFVSNRASEIGSGGVTAFANGGIVSSPTLGLMGEYPGARSNPEVIAPLDKLKSMIGGGQTNVNITGGFKLEGQDLVLALQRADRNRTRIL